MKPKTITYYPIDRFEYGRWAAHTDGDISVAFGRSGEPMSKRPDFRLYGVESLDMLIAALQELRPRIEAAEADLRMVQHD